MKNVKITHSVDYKGVGIKASDKTIPLDDAIADRLIANGHAVEVADKESKKKGDKSE